MAMVLLIPLLVFSTLFTTSRICYGQLGNNLPPPWKSLELIKSLKAKRVKIYDASPQILNALKNTNHGDNATALAVTLSYSCSHGNNLVTRSNPGIRVLDPIRFSGMLAMRLVLIGCSLGSLVELVYFNGLAIQTAKDPNDDEDWNRDLTMESSEDEDEGEILDGDSSDNKVEGDFDVAGLTSLLLWLLQLHHCFLLANFHNKQCPKHTKGCLWRMREILGKKTSKWQIAKWGGRHICMNSMLSQDHKKLDSNFVCSCIVGMVNQEPSISPNFFDQGED